VIDDPQAVTDAPDAVALNRTRAGDTEAYEILRRRHAPAVRRLAWVLVPPGDIDDVVAETFAQVHEVILRGGGPDDAFRLYVLNATRLVSHDWLHSQALHLSATADPAEPFTDVVAGGAGAELIAREFHSLPERWVAVLWHTEIEEASTADAGEVLGLTPEATAVVERQALDALRQSCLQAYISGVTRPECQRVAAQLAASFRDVAANPDRAIAMDHLSTCAECSEFCSDLTGIRNTLRQVIAPIYLGDAAASYLLAAREAAARATAAAEGKPGKAAAANGARRPSLGRLLQAPGQWRWVAEGTAAVLRLPLSSSGWTLPRGRVHRHRYRQRADRQG
jgi:DNA-directed RNA polymerase specialized sigma24 family protein